MMTVAEFLRLHRDDISLSRSEASAMVGCSFNTLNNWERGLAKPKSRFVRKLSKVYGFELEDYLKAYEFSLSKQADQKLNEMRRRLKCR